MRARRKPLNGMSHSLTLQALTPALENRFQTFSTGSIHAAVSRWGGSLLAFATPSQGGEGTELHRCMAYLGAIQLKG